MTSKKNVIVVSARRSGTHLLTDLVVNNFGYESINYNYLDYTKFTGEMELFESAMNEGSYSYKQPYTNHPKVTWTHAHDFKDYLKYNHSKEDNAELDRYFSESKIIFIYRDIRDIINSCYNRPRYKNKYKDFTDFYNNFDFDGYELIDQEYKNISDLLIGYYKNWFSVYMSRELLGLDMEIISYEEIINNYDSSVNKIAGFLEQIIHTPIDVRLENINKLNSNIKYSTNDFRSGKTGEWVNTLDLKLGEEIANKYNLDLGNSLNGFLNDIKIHKYHVPTRDSFQIKSKDWKALEDEIDIKIKQFTNKFKPLEIDIDNRYKDCLEKSLDFRYYHKVFLYKDYVLKFNYPCKATIDKKTFDHVIPVASKQQLLTILETDKYLYENGIVPKLHHAGLYKGVLYVVQERIPTKNILHEKFNFHPKWGDFTWPVKYNVGNQIKKHFYKALENNIILTDIVNAYNCAINQNDNLIYFDLDGIKKFDNKEQLIASEEYKNAIGILNESI